MVDNSFLGIENAVNSSTTFRKNYTTSTPSQQTGYEATYLRDQHLGLGYRAATADVAKTTVLARFADTYRVGMIGGLGHNLSASATWRATLGPEAVRPVWTSDGVDDVGTTSAAIPQTADFTFLMRGFFFPSTINGETSNGIPILLLSGGTNERLRIGYRAANTSSPLQLWIRLVHSGSEVASLLYDMGPDGTEGDLAVTYDDTTKLISLYFNGTLVDSATASAAWVDDGLQSVRIGKATGPNYVKHGYRNMVLYDRALTASEVAAYDHRILTGDERGLQWAPQFLDGSGLTVTDAAGNANITVNSGSVWADRANTLSGYTTGILEATGQWYRRQGLRISTSTSATSASLGTATRDITVAFTVQIDDDHLDGTDEELIVFGPSVANGEVILSATGGVLTATSNRGTPDTVSSISIQGLGLARGRIVLQSTSSTASNLSLYLATGTSDESLVGTVSVGPYDAVALCLLTLGDAAAGSDNTNCILGEVRVYGAVRLEAVASMLDPCDLSDPAVIECLRLDGEAISDVNSASYTMVSATYEDIDNPNVTRSAPGREGLGYPYTSGRDQIESELLDFVPDADVEVSEIYLEIWDRSNASGYVSLGALCCWATFRPDENRATGGERTWKMRKALRTDVGGVPYLEDSYEVPMGKISLKYLGIIDEQDEVYRRVLRARRDKLMALVIEPFRLVGQTQTALPQHLLIDHTVVGTLSASTDTVKEGNERHVEIDIEVEGVRKQTS